MIVNTTEGSWIIGNTSFNIGEKNSYFVELFLMAVKDYNESGLRKNFNSFDSGEQKSFFDYCNNFYPDLARNKKDLEAAVRKKKAFFTSYNFVDNNLNLKEYGEILIDTKLSNDVISYSNKLGFSSMDIATILGAASSEARKIKDFYPIVDLLNHLLNNKKIPLFNLWVSRYCESKDEFNLILNMDKTALDNYIIDFLMKSDLEDLKNRKTQENELIFKENCMGFLKEWLSVEPSSKSEKKEIITRWSSKFDKNAQKNRFRFFSKNAWIINIILNLNADIDVQKIFQVISHYSLWTKPNYKQQFKIFSKLSKIFYLDNENIVWNEDILNVKYFYRKNGKVHIDFHQGINNNLSKNMSWLNNFIKVFEHEDILSDLMKEEFYSLEKYPEEIKSRQRFVLLEYFVAIKLMKQFSLDFNEVTNMGVYPDGSPKSHAPGRGPDFYIENRNLVIEVTTSYGRNVEKMELEPVPRHLSGKINQENKNKAMAIFIAGEDIPKRIYHEFILKKKQGFFKNDSFYIEELNIISLTIKQFNSLLKDKDEFYKKLELLSDLDRKQIDKFEEINFAHEWDKNEYENEKWKIIQN